MQPKHGAHEVGQRVVAKVGAHIPGSRGQVRQHKVEISKASWDPYVIAKLSWLVGNCQASFTQLTNPAGLTRCAASHWEA
jgi:hypothetical protein